MSLPVLLKIDLWDHPKTFDFAERVGLSRTLAVGYLAAFWRFCSRFAPSGDLSRVKDAPIAAGCEWEGEPAEFIRHLTESGWIDGSRQAHDFTEHQGKRAMERLRDAARKQAKRDKERKALADTTRTKTGQKPDSVPNSTGQQPDPFAVAGSVAVAVAGSLAVPEALTTHTEGRAREAFLRTSFAAFWAIYPNKAKQTLAMHAWSDLAGLDATLAAAITAGAKAHAASWRWREQDGRYVPEAHKWLELRRWTEPAGGSEPPRAPGVERPSGERATDDWKARQDADEKAAKAREAAMTPEEKAEVQRKIEEGKKLFGVRA